MEKTKGSRGLEVVRNVKRETEILMTYPEAFFLYETVRKSEKIEGDVAEVGVFKGGSAKLIREATQKPLHLFDTFEGLPELSDKDNPDQFQKGNFSASLEGVKNYLKEYRNVYFYKGRFPLTAEPIENKKFSFVNIDVDIYQSTMDCLRFFYPRMSKGGCMLCHDYLVDGARKSFNEFFKDKPEIIIEPFATGQALVIKV